MCSTYGSRHMQEISRLVSGYDKRIALEADKLFEKFGLDNGDKILKKHFSDVERRDYKDALVVDEAEPLVDIYYHVMAIRKSTLWISIQILKNM